MTEPPTVASLIALAVAAREGLARELGALVLVGPRPVDDGEWSFRTFSTSTLRDAEGKIEAVLDQGFVVYPVKKARPDSPFRNTILVGRSRTNDVCIAHSSVSKLHARVRVDDGGSLFLSDAASSNGTSLDGTQLQPDQEHPLVSGAFVRFGDCSMQAFEPERFVGMLVRLAHR